MKKMDEETIQEPTEVSPDTSVQKDKSKIFIYLIPLLIILVFGVIVLITIDNFVEEETTIQLNELQEGVSYAVKEGQEIKLNLNDNSQHLIFIKKVENISINFLLDNIEYFVVEGNSTNVDFDADNFYDLKIDYENKEIIFNTLNKSICEECQYLENNSCVDYVCCNDTDCDDENNDTEDKCFNAKTIEAECVNEIVVCGNCRYRVNGTCISYNCCSDSDCDDENKTTTDKCYYPNTPSSECVNEVENECEINSDCDDENSCTINSCTGFPKICEYSQILNCTNSDDCCPPGCNSTTDNDCE